MWKLDKINPESIDVHHFHDFLVRSPNLTKLCLSASPEHKNIDPETSDELLKAIVTDTFIQDLEFFQTSSDLSRRKEKILVNSKLKTLKIGMCDLDSIDLPNLQNFTCDVGNKSSQDFLTNHPKLQFWSIGNSNVLFPLSIFNDLNIMHSLEGLFIPNFPLEEDSLQTLFNILKKSSYLVKLGIKMGVKYLDYVSDYLENNSAKSLEYLTVGLCENNRTWKPEPQRIRLIQVLAKNSHIRVFACHFVEAPDAQILECIQANPYITSLRLSTFPGQDVTDALVSNRRKFQAKCRQLLLKKILMAEKCGLQLEKTCIEEILRMSSHSTKTTNSILKQ
jgi:hypothetical protein